VANEGGDRDSNDSADSLLRAIAAVPDVALPVVPERIAHFRIVGVLGRGGMGVTAPTTKVSAATSR
jgi:hypothetical protein